MLLWGFEGCLELEGSGLVSGLGNRAWDISSGGGGAGRR